MPITILARQGEHNEQIMVYETNELFGEKGAFRVLQFADEAVQGAIDLADPKRIIFEYPRAIIHLIEANDLNSNIFIAGHGVGTISSYFHNERCVTAEINSTVAAWSSQYFSCHQTELHIADGMQVLEQASERFHTIVIDAFSAQGVPKHFTSSTFFQLVKSKLHSPGAIIINMLGKGAGDTVIKAVFTTLSTQFAHVYAFLLASEHHRDIRNILLVGSNSPLQYQSRRLAGFERFYPEPGYIIYD